MKKERTNISIDLDLKAKGHRVAKQQKRSFSNLIELLIDKLEENETNKR